MPTLIIPFRNSDRYRLANLLAVESFYYSQFPEWQVIIVEQDAKPTLELNFFAGSPKLIFAFNAGLFNKSWAINIAFKQSTEQVLLIGDADMVVAPTALKKSLDAVDQELDVVRPFRNLIDLDQKETQCFLDSGSIENSTKDSMLDRNYANESLCLAGGFFLIKNECFGKLKGFDERFEGWGGEDDAFSIIVQSVSNKTAILREGIAWHCWHPRSKAQEGQAYKKNCLLLAEYKNIDTVMSYIQDEKYQIGQLNKYR